MLQYNLKSLLNELDNKEQRTKQENGILHELKHLDKKEKLFCYCPACGKYLSVATSNIDEGEYSDICPVCER